MNFKCKIFLIVFLKKSLHSLRSGIIFLRKITEKDVLINLINFVYPLMSFNLIPIKDIHLYAESAGPKPSGNLNHLYLFLLVGALTLFIACINFINLSTASSMTRAKEIGVRKVLGAQRSSLIAQFLSESILLSFFSFIISMGITFLALPSLNNLTGIEIPYSAVFNPIILSLFFGIFLLTGFLAGLYPAFFVTRFRPVSVIKGVLGANKNRVMNGFEKD